MMHCIPCHIIDGTDEIDMRAPATWRPAPCAGRAVVAASGAPEDNAISPISLVTPISLSLKLRHGLQ